MDSTDLHHDPHTGRPFECGQGVVTLLALPLKALSRPFVLHPRQCGLSVRFSVRREGGPEDALHSAPPAEYPQTTQSQCCLAR